VNNQKYRGGEGRRDWPAALD